MSTVDPVRFWYFLAAFVHLDASSIRNISTAIPDFYQSHAHAAVFTV